MSPWQVLGIEPIEDPRAIKQAYARALKQHRPDSDPEGYQRLRECYEWVLGWVEWQRQHLEDSEDEAEDADGSHYDEPDPVAVRIREAAGANAVDAGEQTSTSPPQVNGVDLQVREPCASCSTPEDEHAFNAAHADTSQEAATPIVDLDALLASVDEHWKSRRSAALVEVLPKLTGLLHQAPLNMQAEASYRFAIWVTREQLPFEAVATLQQHFDWGRDFRADRVLGDELADALCKRLTQHRLLRGIDLAVAEHNKLHSEHPHRHLERQVWPDDAALAEHFHPLSELQRRLLEQPAWRSLLFAMSLPGKLVGLLHEPTFTDGYLRARLGERSVSEQQRLFSLLQAILLVGLAAVGFALAILAGLDGLAAGALSAGVMVSALGTAGFAPLLSVPLDGALNALRETVPGPLEPGLVRSLIALGLAGLALLWSLGILGVEPTIWGSLGLSALALVMAWNPNSHWRALLVPGIGLSALAISHHFAPALSTTQAIAIASFGTLALDLVCQRLGLGNRFGHGHFGTLLMYQSIPLVFLGLLEMGGGGIAGHTPLICLLMLLLPMLFHLATQHGVERVLAWLGFSVSIGELLLAEGPYRALWLVASPTLLWASLGTMAALARESAGLPPRRS
jgi:hypothetical protein